MVIGVRGVASQKACVGLYVVRPASPGATTEDDPWALAYGREMSRGNTVVLAAAVMLGVAPAVAVGASTWTSPQRLSAAAARGTPTIAFDARGWALATWAPAVDGGRRSASRSPSASSFRASRAAPDIGEEVIEALPPAPIADHSGNVVAVEQRKIRAACGLATIYDLTPRLGRMNGEFYRALGRWTVYSHTEPPALALGGNARGVAVAAWLQLERDARGRCVNRELVRVAVRRPGAKFSSPITLARGDFAGVGTLTASVGPTGEILVAWRHGQSIETRSRSVDGTWGRIRAIATGRVDSLASIVTADGTTALVWTQMPSSSPLENPRSIGAAVRRAGRTKFGLLTLDRGTWPVTLIDRPERRSIRLKLLRRGAIAAWTSWAGDHLQVLTSAMANGRFGATRHATPEGQDFALGDLAVSAAGRPAIAVVSAASVVPRGPFVALGRADGSFDVPELVGSEAVPSINGASLAFSPLTGRPTLVWTAYKTVLTSNRR